MDAGDGTVCCSVNAEWLNGQGIVQRTLAHKKAFLRLIRDDQRKIFVELSADKSASVRLHLKSVNVHNKFMKEGKATIKFQDERCTLMLSNAPPANLQGFLRTMFIKMTGEKKVQSSASLRTQLLSGKKNQFDEISPVTGAEVEKAFQKVSKKTDTTPSPSGRKRKISADGDRARGPAAKKLYAASPLPQEVLNPQQKEVFDACMTGRNVFFTGSAGTGKSFLLRRIIAALPPDVTTATASTGVAACHIGGITLHQFAGIGGGDAVLERCIEMASKPAQAAIWRKCKHLIIDEISMVDGTYFQKIETVARKVRRSNKPFGGIQLIICGDFLQLPPVVKTKGFQQQQQQRGPKFCFQSQAWGRCVQASYELTQVHRQRELDFIDVLNSVRVGRVTDAVADRLRATAKQQIERDGILATRLCSHTQDARAINQAKLAALPGELTAVQAQDSDPHLATMLDQATNVPQKLELKVGAQVMLLKNINIAQGLVNGARGVVKGFQEGVPLVKFRNREYLAKPERWSIRTAAGMTLSRRQVPLQLAWAFSIHKSQGLTLDCVEMSLGRVFEAGQAYVALSRAQSMHTLRVLDFQPTQVWANPDVLTFYKDMAREMDVLRLVPLGPDKNKKKAATTAKGRLVKKMLKMDKPLVSIS